MNAPDDLTSLLELCFGDADDDDEGLRDLRVQLDAYPDRAERFRDGLSALLKSGSEEQCSDILETWTHRSLPGGEARVWLRGLADQLGVA